LYLILQIDGVFVAILKNFIKTFILQRHIVVTKDVVVPFVVMGVQVGG
jgi:hypothetical protein